MHIPLWTILPYATRHNGPWLVERTDTPDICLPIQLQAAVPNCAYQCLQTFIADNYNILDCDATSDIDFLCTNPTLSGLTIGEGSLQCVVSNCLAVDLQTQSGYTICDGIAGALPEMAGTITATISAVSTAFASSDPSFASTTSTPDVAATSDVLSSTTSSQVLETSLSSPAASSTSLTSSTPLFNTPSSTSETAASSSQSVSAPLTTVSSSNFSSISSSVEISSTTGASSVSTRISTSGSSSSRSATNSATMAAATEDATVTKLGTSAVAGIVTAVVIVVAMIIGFLAYWFCVRRRAEKRRSQRFSTMFGAAYTQGRSDSTSAAPEGHGGLFSNPARRFYSRELSQDGPTSFWRRSAVEPDDIGIATAPGARVSPESRLDAQSGQQSLPTISKPAVAMHIERTAAPENMDQWSFPISPADDYSAWTQAQNQDLPALASPRTRRSSRSVSSIGVEKPAPLQLNKLKQLPSVPTRGMIPLTPVYDNGTFEPTIRQIVDDTNQPAGLIRLSRERQTPNFSRREPSLTRTSQDAIHAGPLQNPLPLRPPYQTRFPIKPTAPPRKESETTDRSMSVHTEFDEDSTPEDEADKQLTAPRQPPLQGRLPLSNVQYPAVPRPAAMRKQASAPHSPRSLTIRRVDPNIDTSPAEIDSTVRVRKAPTNLSNFNVSSNSSFDSKSTESPIFPTPPPRNPARLSRMQHPEHLRSQIADAYRVASRPLTTTSMSSVVTSGRLNSEYPPSAYPGATAAADARSRSQQQQQRQYEYQYQYQQPQQQQPQFDSPSAQRLSARQERGRGRPLAKRMQAQGYIPRPSQPQSQQYNMSTSMQMPMSASAPNAGVGPQNPRRPHMGPRDGDLYFRV